MFNISKLRPTHGARLERWLGADTVAHLSASMKDWYGPPIAVGTVPGAVWAHGGGDFHGPIKSGEVLNGIDFAFLKLRSRLRKFGMLQSQITGAGFASFADLVAEASAGKSRTITMSKNGATGVVAVTNSLWRLGAQPAAGAAGSAAPGGRAPTGSGTTGAQYGLDNVSSDTRHIVSGWATASVAGNSLMLYDRIFDVAKTMNSSATESVTGVPTRYQSSTATAADYAGGNFCFVEVGGTALAGTAHNWTVCRYRNQAGTDTISFPSMTGNSGAIVDRLDHPTSSWFMPLASGDTGVMDLDQMQCSAAVATGLINFVIGHPLVVMPVPIINLACPLDGLNTAFSLARVFDDAALAWLEITKPATNGTNYNAQVTMVHG